MPFNILSVYTSKLYINDVLQKNLNKTLQDMLVIIKYNLKVI